MLIWQHLLGIELYWIVLALAIIILLAVGSDYNLLVVSRFKEEIGAGLNTGLIRTMAGTGSVVTAAGLVFAFTMCGFIFGDLMVLAQIGTTIGIGLIFDTLIVRSFGAVDRRPDGAVVLVAAEGTAAAGQHHAAAVRHPGVGADAAARGPRALRRGTAIRARPGSRRAGLASTPPRLIGSA